MAFEQMITDLVWFLINDIFGSAILTGFLVGIFIFTIGLLSDMTAYNLMVLALFITTGTMTLIGLPPVVIAIVSVVLGFTFFYINKRLWG